LYLARSCAVFAKAQLQTSDDYLHRLTYKLFNCLLVSSILAQPRGNFNLLLLKADAILLNENYAWFQFLDTVLAKVATLATICNDFQLTK
jgi:hypothetical protein